MAGAVKRCGMNEHVTSRDEISGPSRTSTPADPVTVYVARRGKTSLGGSASGCGSPSPEPGNTTSSQYARDAPSSAGTYRGAHAYSSWKKSASASVAYSESSS